ncbi:DUF1740-domain-containing protein [Viridothelium virens]|uniref:DUF1740-domain-containing protein n=1 Tax=Viridothelium virens TaxID=1048519 RepID=A0A6A6GZK6_VIRVR|nr:DUF1740-domain-containing protein [Viridothelium virens]
MSTQSNQVAAPRFGSFKPKGKSRQTEADHSQEARAETSSIHSEQEATEHATRRRKHDNRNNKKRRHHYRYGDRQEVLSEARKKLHEPNIVLATWEEEPSLYVIDVNGDSQNIAYARPNTYHVPAYRREAAGGVLGYDSRWKIDRQRSKEQDLVVVDSEAPDESKRSENLLSSVGIQENGRCRVIGPMKKRLDEDVAAEFIGLYPERKTNRNSPHVDTRLRDDKELDYAALDSTRSHQYGSFESDRETPDCLDQAGSEYEDEQETSLQNENARLSRLVRDEPHNVIAWIRYIDHQDFVIHHGRENYSMKISDRRASSQVKITICENALKSIGKDTPGRETLLLKLVDEGLQTWDAGTTARRLQDILRKNPTIFPLRIRYLNFVQVDSSTFRYEHCREVMLDALKALKPMENSESTGQATAQTVWSLAEQQMYLFLRLTRLILESGYQEHAVALWQSTIEFYLFRPKPLAYSIAGSNSQTDLMKSFEEFWDEEVPRFGEPNARGWCMFHESGGASRDPATYHVDSSFNPDGDWKNFAETEKRLMHALREPGRTSEEIGSNDPYHTILSSDILPYLSLLPCSMDHELLVDALTCFCQLPPAPMSKRPTSRQQWWLDPFLRNDLLQPIMESGYRTVDVHSPLRQHGLSFGQFTTTTLFSHPIMSQFLSVPIEWMRCALKGLTDAIPQSDNLAEYRLVFEYQHDSKNAKRIAKSLLKVRSSSLRLWNAYALGEYRYGRVEVADNVITTALQMSKTFSEASRGDTILLFQTWIWAALHQLDLDMALERALRLNAGFDGSQSIAPKIMDKLNMKQSILGARNTLEKHQLVALSAREHERFVAFTDCLALVAYLPEKSIAEAISVYQSTSSLLASWGLASAPVTELIHQAEAQLIAYHISGGQNLKYDHDYPSSSLHAPQRGWIYSPELIRQTLRESLSRFPDNCFILDAHVHNELRFPVIDRDTALSKFSQFSIRQDLPQGLERKVMSRPSSEEHEASNNLGLDGTSVIRCFHSILACIARLHSQPEEHSATIYKARSMFERIVSLGSGQHNAGLWALYLEFEVYIAGKGGDLERAWTVFLQGLRAVPWCKAFAIVGFVHLGEHRAGDIAGVWEMMVERELRLHVDMEPFLGRMRQLRQAKG